MSVGTGGSEPEAIASINTTPLVDVMLVLLIIFLITIPIITKTIKLNLPKAVNIPTQTKPENIVISVNAQGDMYWNGQLVRDTRELTDLTKTVAIKTPQPEVHIRGDVNTLYKDIGKTLYGVQRGGIIRIGFITEPDRGTPLR
jgi:biopolymer transport protein ExbD